MWKQTVCCKLKTVSSQLPSVSTPVQSPFISVFLVFFCFQSKHTVQTTSRVIFFLPPFRSPSCIIGVLCSPCFISPADNLSPYLPGSFSQSITLHCSVRIAAVIYQNIFCNQRAIFWAWQSISLVLYCNKTPLQ